MEPVYKRLLLKLSGEVLAGEAGHGFDFNVIKVFLRKFPTNVLLKLLG